MKKTVGIKLDEEIIKEKEDLNISWQSIIVYGINSFKNNKINNEVESRINERLTKIQTQLDALKMLVYTK